MSKQETTFREKFIRTMRERFGKRFYWQVHHGSAAMSGLLDLMVVVDGRTSHLELKMAVDSRTTAVRVSDQPTPLQFDTMRRIALAGGNALLAVSDPDTSSVIFLPFARLNELRGRKENVLRAQVKDMLEYSAAPFEADEFDTNAPSLTGSTALHWAAISNADPSVHDLGCAAMLKRQPWQVRELFGREVAVPA